MTYQLPAGYEQYPPSEQIQMLLRDLDQATNKANAWQSMYETMVELNRQADHYRKLYGCEHCANKTA